MVGVDGQGKNFLRSIKSEFVHQFLGDNFRLEVGCVRVMDKVNQGYKIGNVPRTGRQACEPELDRMISRIGVDVGVDTVDIVLQESA